jgi:hypothetical protein
VPVNQRGTYLALVTLAVFPFTPYLMYSQLLSTYHTWRWCLWICLYLFHSVDCETLTDDGSIWNGIFWVGIALTYFPHSQTRVKGEKARQILGEIDYFGGFTSIGGLTLLYAATLSLFP